MNARLHDALSVVIKVVTHIKSNSLRDRLFREFCKQNGEEFEQLVLHTEVRWLSKGNRLKCFIALRDSIVSFLAEKQLGASLLASKCDPCSTDQIYLKNLIHLINSSKKTILI
ncbi:protein FAM200A-like [Artemia franciscana]|uniref:protein FAM200A-like n=1 Tax=Artemia franciscana TaxID=6661 RepID=UPI0032DAFBAF